MFAMHHDWITPLSRRHFLKVMGGLGALGVSTTAYGFSAPVLRLRVSRYNIRPRNGRRVSSSRSLR